MSATISADADVLKRFRKAVDEAYGERISRVVLFGSRARGDARPDSDYDIAVFLTERGDLWHELGVLARISTDLFYVTGAMVSAKPFDAAFYEERSPLMGEIRRDGRDI